MKKKIIPDCVMCETHFSLDLRTKNAFALLINLVSTFFNAETIMIQYVTLQFLAKHSL
ncbi:MAG: hypothetical protein PHN89_02860 [Candidatus Pacebacteria bacterium]|nr:hypothetical protein [Candidatus Paceibacterota bacterium]